MPLEIPKGYTKDVVDVECGVCGKKERCKWKRNPTPGINFRRPMIELPDDWKVLFDFDQKTQVPICDTCELREAPGHPLLGRD